MGGDGEGMGRKGGEGEVMTDEGETHLKFSLTKCVSYSGQLTGYKLVKGPVLERVTEQEKERVK